MTIPLESAGIFIFFFVFPLAFSLTVFMSRLSREPSSAAPVTVGILYIRGTF